MAKARSPSYPIVGLKEAIDRVRLVWEQDYTAELPREVIAQHMGYSLNGKSLGLLSTMGKYGLLEGRGDQTRVTDLAVQILAHEAGSPERAQAVQEAAQQPDLFKDIDAKFDGRSPSDQALRSYLLTRGFTLSAVDAAIRSFRDTEGFARSEVAGYGVSSETQPTETEMLSEISTPQNQLLSPSRAGVPTISMSDDGLEIGGGVISTLAQFEKLMKRLSAGKLLLESDDDAED